MAISNITVQDAHQRQQAGALLIDVRSTREYAAGHPAGSINIPVLEHDEDNGELVANPDFVRVVKARASSDQPLLISCQSGRRSVRASQMLEAFGYADVANVLGGFGGSREGGDQGWQPAGLPVEAETPGGSYAELLKKADEA